MAKKRLPYKFRSKRAPFRTNTATEQIRQLAAELSVLRGAEGTHLAENTRLQRRVTSAEAKADEAKAEIEGLQTKLDVIQRNADRDRSFAKGQAAGFNSAFVSLGRGLSGKFFG